MDLFDSKSAPRGVATLVKTPFLDDWGLDEESYRRQVQLVVKAGTVMLIPGMAGCETFSLRQKDRERSIEICLEEANGNLPVCATVCGIDVHEIVGRAQDAVRMGADMVAQVVPAWMRREEDSVGAIKALAESVEVPVMFHSVYGSHVGIISTQSMVKIIQEHDNARYVKIEGPRYINQSAALHAVAGETLCGLMSGPSLVGMCYRAGCSLIMTAADLIELRVATFEALERGDDDEAARIEALDKSVSFIKSYVPGEIVNKTILEWRGIFASKKLGAPQFGNVTTEMNPEEEKELADSLKPVLSFFKEAPPTLPST